MSIKKQYIPAPLASAVKGGYVTDTSEILDENKGKRQHVINQETDNEISGIKGGSTKSIADLSEDIANEAERASGVEAGLRESIDELGQIGLNPENAISTNGDDFDVKLNTEERGDLDFPLFVLAVKCCKLFGGFWNNAYLCTA